MITDYEAKNLNVFLCCAFEKLVLFRQVEGTHILCADNFMTLIIWLRTKSFFSMDKVHLFTVIESLFKSLENLRML